jgi:hypothetical protein
VYSFKVDIIIPKFYNDGTKIDASKHVETYRDIIKHFGDCTEDRSPLKGDWTDPKTGEKHKDRNFSYWIICNDNYPNMYFLEEFKKTLIERYDQKEILMYYTMVFSI